MSDLHQIIPRRDVFKVFSTERIEEEVRVFCDESSSSLQLSNFQRNLDYLDGITGSYPQQSKREHEKEISRKTDRCLKRANKFSVYCTNLTQPLSQKDNQVKKLGSICYSIWPGFVFRSLWSRSNLHASRRK